MGAGNPAIRRNGGLAPARAEGVRTIDVVSGAIALLVGASMLAACSAVERSVDATLCRSAATLSTALALGERASARDHAGDRQGAEADARRVRRLVDQGYDELQSITSGDVKRGDTWQALFDASLHVGQGANALLPDYASTYGITDGELARASDLLHTAALSLPSGCDPRSASEVNP